MSMWGYKNENKNTIVCLDTGVSAGWDSMMTGLGCCGATASHISPIFCFVFFVILKVNRPIKTKQRDFPSRYWSVCGLGQYDGRSGLLWGYNLTNFTNILGYVRRYIKSK